MQRLTAPVQVDLTVMHSGSVRQRQSGRVDASANRPQDTTNKLDSKKRSSGDNIIFCSEHTVNDDKPSTA